MSFLNKFKGYSAEITLNTMSTRVFLSVSSHVCAQYRNFYFTQLSTWVCQLLLYVSSNNTRNIQLQLQLPKLSCPKDEFNCKFAQAVCIA